MKKKNIFNLIPMWAFMLAAVIVFAATNDASAFVIMAAGPAASTGTYSQQYVSLWSINKLAYYPTLYKKFGDQGMEFVGMCEAMGWTADMSVQLIKHKEDDWIVDNFAVDAQGGGAAGAAVTLTIDASSIDADGNFYVGAKDVIMFTDMYLGENIQGYVSSPTATTITVTPVKAAWSIPATTNGQVLFIVTNANGEGTGQPTPKVTRYNDYENTFATVKNTVDWTGAESVNDLWFENYGDEKVNGIVGLASLQLDARMAKSTQGMILSGQKYESITDGGKPVTGTEGLFAALNRAGIPIGYSTWGLASYDYMEKLLTKVYAGVTTGMLMGINIDITNENVLSDFLKHTDVEYATKVGNAMVFGDEEGVETANKLSVAINFGYIVKAKRRWGFKRFTAMSDPKTYGTDGFDFESNFIGFPLRSDNMDAKSKAKIPAMRTVHRLKNGYSRRNEMFWTGSANAAKYGNTNDIDTRELNVRSDIGFEVFGVNQFINGFAN